MAHSAKIWLMLALSAWLLVGCRPSEPPAPPLRPVKVIRVQDESVLTDRWLPGRARATKEINLAFRVSGPLIELAFTVGDQVQAGDVVARIDPRDFQVSYQAAESNVAVARAQLQAMQIGARPEEIMQLRSMVEQAEARLRTATSEFARAERLLEGNAISQAEFDQASEAAVRADAELRRAEDELRIGESGARPEDIAAKQAEIRSLESAADSARNQLSDTQLQSPFDGIVVARYVENFEQVRAQQSILRVLDASQIEMVVNVPESGISLAPFITDVEVLFDAFPDLMIPARVTEVGTEASLTTRTYPLTLLMDQPENGRILPGMAGRARGRVTLPDKTAKSIEIPEGAIFEQAGRSLVWVLKTEDQQTGTAMPREVTVGELSARGLRVVAGLQPGELVAIAGVNFMAEGQQLRLLFDAQLESPR